MLNKLFITSLLATTFALTACGDKNDNTEATTETQATQAPAESETQSTTQPEDNTEASSTNDVADSFEPGEVEASVEEDQQF